MGVEGLVVFVCIGLGVGSVIGCFGGGIGCSFIVMVCFCVWFGIMIWCWF